VLVARDGEVLLHRGYGMADAEAGVPNGPETVYDIGSITKPVTALAILALEEEGRLRTTDPITRFFPEVPEDKRGITLHHLLTHSAGLIGDLGGDYEAMPRDTLVRRALASGLRWAPGTRYAYSNLGYSLLGAVVEIASGEPYEQYLRDRILLPAGMERTGYVLPSGARIGVTVADAWGEEAAALLAGIPPGRRAGLAALGERGAAALAGLVRGDPAPLEAASHAPERIRGTLERLLRTGEEALGPFRDVEILGTVPAWWSGREDPASFPMARENAAL
jgi:CubicO group peptidase (beta-lactamase class C family)